MGRKRKADGWGEEEEEEEEEEKAKAPKRPELDFYSEKDLKTLHERLPKPIPMSESGSNAWMHTSNSVLPGCPAGHVIMMSPLGPMIIPANMQVCPSGASAMGSKGDGLGSRKPNLAKIAATQATKKAVSEGRRLFIANMDRHLQAEDSRLMGEHFDKYGTMTECCILSNKGVGFITFTRAEDAKAAKAGVEGMIVPQIMTTIKNHHGICIRIDNHFSRRGDGAHSR